MEKAAATNNEFYRKAAELLELAVIQDKVEERTKLLEEALKNALFYHRQYERDPEGKHLIGFIYYRLSENAPEALENSERFFREALELNPDHQYARYYLACLYFDQKRYKESLKHFNKLRKEEFHSMDQSWMAVKAEESELCCKLYLGQSIDGLSRLDRVVQLYSSFENICEAPVPRELGDCLNSCLTAGSIPKDEADRFYSTFSSLIEALDIRQLAEERWPKLFKR